MAIEIPSDLILPLPETPKEQELYKTLTDYSKSVARAIDSIGEDSDEKVKATSGDTAGYLDAKVDNVTIEVSGNKLQVIAGSGVSGAGGDGLTESGGILSVNVDNDTIEINADTLRVKNDGIDGLKIQLDNDQFLVGRDLGDTTDIEIIKANTLGYAEIGASLILPSGVAINEFSSDTTLTGNSDTAIPTEKAVKTYVDNTVLPSSSNAVFTYSSLDTSTTIGTTSASYVDKLPFKFKKISGVSTITLWARGYTGDTGGGVETLWVKCDIGGQNNETSMNSTTPAWLTSVNIDVSGLSNGTTYDGVIQIKMADGLENVYLTAVTLIAS